MMRDGNNVNAGAPIFGVLHYVVLVEFAVSE